MSKPRLVRIKEQIKLGSDSNCWSFTVSLLTEIAPSRLLIAELLVAVVQDSRKYISKQK